MHGQLIGPRAEQVAGNADVIAQIEQLIEREAIVAHGVFADVDLQPHPLLLQSGEACLALRANGHQPSADGDARVLSLKLLAGFLVPVGADLRQGRGPLFLLGREAVGIGGLAELHDLR